jgi:hypothetical protein
MSKNTLKLIIILAVAIGLLLGLTFLLKNKETPLKVISVSPYNQEEKISVSSPIKIEFNRPLKNTGEVSILINPQIPTISTFENKRQTLILDHPGPFHSGTSYQITVDQANQPLWSSTFATEKLEGDPAIPYESEKFTQENYPLLVFVPYDSQNFYITYNGPLALKVIIKNGSIQTIGKEVADWIKSHGVDPTTHKIEYLTPELSPAL